jgi:nucleolar protein 56
VLTLRTTWFGAFLLEGAEVRAKELFPKDALEIARRLDLLQQGELLSEERRVSQGVSGFRVTERRQLKLGSLAPAEESPVDLASRGGEFGFGDELRREAFQLLAKSSVARARGRDAGVVQAVRAFDELQESENRVNERLREWYGLHFPELARLVPTEKYAGLVAKGEPREEVLKGLGLGEAASSGSPLSEADMAAVRSFASAAVALRRESDEQAKALKSAVREVAPNLSELLGPLLAARLIESAGSLERLARLPSSTVQLLGAERALFRHLREGKAPPKHGVLFLHPSVHGAPHWARGRIARALAGKATIAARVDAAGRRSDLGAALRATFERRVKAVLAQKPAQGAGGRKAPSGRGAPSPGPRKGKPRR